MEPASVCFAPPLNNCFPLSYGAPLPQVRTHDDDLLTDFDEEVE
jgi:hypothetical protein